jgi:hypothetical protein
MGTMAMRSTGCGRSGNSRSPPRVGHYQERPFGLAVAVRIGRHTHPKARREIAPAAAPTGIDYLGLLADRRDAELAGPRIDYARLANNENEIRDINEQEEDDR